MSEAMDGAGWWLIAPSDDFDGSPGAPFVWGAQEYVISVWRMLWNMADQMPPDAEGPGYLWTVPHSGPIWIATLDGGERWA